jgi:glycerol uptake facilitator-like aquaporin
VASDPCFFERHPGRELARRASAEGLGTLLLVLVVAGATMALQASRQPTVGAGLVTTAFAASSALAGLIVAFGPLTGGHFNPLITLLQWLARERRTDCMLAYIAAQVVGGLIGAALANALYPEAVRAPSPHTTLPTELLSELTATAGLMVIVQACSRASVREGGPFAVGAWLGGAIVATPTLSLANPAIVVAALASDGPMALRPGPASAFIVAELCGALIAFAVVRWIYPRTPGIAIESATEDRSAMHEREPGNT